MRGFGFLGVWIAVAMAVYAETASANANPTGRPLVFVPGIVGSLLAENGDVVWGDLGSLNGSNFEKLDLLPPSGAPVQLAAIDVLRDIPVLFGLFRVGVYSDLIDFLVEDLNYVEGQDLFVFAYDWRRTNFASAKHLNDFIAASIGDQQYDIIAHSMGGIITRIMLAGGRRDGLCETGRPAPELAEPVDAESLQTVCEAMYGPGAENWPSEAFSGPYPTARNLHTYIEMAVPHFGSNNVVATYLKGWGRLTDVLTGGLETIQSVILSMASPMELAPVYENCCALGRADRADNVPFVRLEQKLDFARWSEKILGFDTSPCPYPRCEIRKRLFAEALGTRKVIDSILRQGVPPSVRQIHVFMGTEVEDTNIVHYVARDARGAGDGVSFRANKDGDGTVPFVSAQPPEAYPDYNVQTHVAARVAHPFIFESKALKDQLRYAILNPGHGAPIQVASAEIPVGGSTLSSSSLTLQPQIAFARELLHVTLKMTLANSADKTQLSSEAFFASVRSAKTNEAGDHVALAIDHAHTFIGFGEIILTGTVVAPVDPGLYIVDATLERAGGATILDKALFIIVEQE